MFLQYFALYHLLLCQSQQLLLLVHLNNKNNFNLFMFLQYFALYHLLLCQSQQLLLLVHLNNKNNFNLFMFLQYFALYHLFNVPITAAFVVGTFE